MGVFADVELDELVLRGPRLTLRPWRVKDADAVFAIMQDRGMHEFLALPEPYTHEVAMRFVSELGDEGRRDGTGIDCAVAETATGRLVGSAALRLTGQRDVGYWVAPDARGHGYAAEATRTLAEWGFAHGLRRVQVLCDVRNLASVRTALAVGFRYEGTVRDLLQRPLDVSAPERLSDLAWFGRLATEPGEPVPPTFTPLPAGGLGDGVVSLRAMAPADAPALGETDDQLTLEWGFTGRAHSTDEVRRAADHAGLDWLVGGVAPFTIVDDESGRAAGSLRVRLAGPPGVGGLGYVVHPDFRGRGYTTRALRLLVPWAFGPGGFARLELGAKAGNVASQRVAEAAGFESDGVRAGRLRNPDGSYSDEVRFCLVNPAIERR
ncbi:MAG: GNAT family N-acetyltransferase [Jatrophihabitantaceae bacterium]